MIAIIQKSDSVLERMFYQVNFAFYNIYIEAGINCEVTKPQHER